MMYSTVHIQPGVKIFDAHEFTLKGMAELFYPQLKDIEYYIRETPYISFEFAGETINLEDTMIVHEAKDQLKRKFRRGYCARCVLKTIDRVNHFFIQIIHVPESEQFKFGCSDFMYVEFTGNIKDALPPAGKFLPQGT